MRKINTSFLPQLLRFFVAAGTTAAVVGGVSGFIVIDGALPSASTRRASSLLSTFENRSVLHASRAEDINRSVVLPFSTTERISTAAPVVTEDESQLATSIQTITPNTKQGEAYDVINVQRDNNNEAAAATYRRGLITIAGITFLFASNSPVLHAAFSSTSTTASTMGCPVLLLNAACSCVAAITMLAAGPFLDHNVEKPIQLFRKNSSAMNSNCDDSENVPTAMDPGTSVSSSSTTASFQTIQAGTELGLWKFLGTVLNLYGLSLTTADHGAFLIQLTTLFVPMAQGILGVPIPQRIWTAIGLAIAGVALFTSDTTAAAAASTAALSSSSAVGDAACVGAAVLYATYDLRLFHWGKRVDPLPLITTKIATQTALSLAVLVAFAWQPSLEFLEAATPHDQMLVGFATLWSGVAVNAVAPFLQIGGQQIVGPARAQILYASQPLWASMLAWVFLGERINSASGWLGGGAFLTAMLLAATAELPDPDCGSDLCET